MLTQEENDLLTLTGPGTKGGAFLRSYWLPAALSEELPAGGAPLRIRLLGEDLVLFRDDDGRPGILGLHCPHRRADLSMGRIEDGGLRCLYHGWLFDVHGACLDQPSEPPANDFKHKVKHLSYPCQEKAGLIFAYLGSGTPPLIPALEPLTVPAEHRYVTKLYHDCNYFQALEGNMDPSHTSFLHRQLDAPPDLKRPVAGTNGTLPMHFYIRDSAPHIETVDTDYGARVIAVRQASPAKMYFRLQNFILPSIATVVGPMGGDGYYMFWHVPIDDTRHWRYEIMFRRSAPLDESDWKRIREIRAEAGEDYKPFRNKANNYLQDRDAMKTWSFSGMGRIFNTQDVAIVEGSGAILDRTQEYLGSSDKAIITCRRIALKAIRDVQSGKEPPNVVRSPQANRFDHITCISDLTETADWKTYMEKRLS
jgi:phenylpropionate dioxygenase-like ring-hydroxylating dioxygenase large terminal subunit